MKEKILTVQNLTKTYHTGRGAIDISFEINAGDAFGLLGSNGAGKTTIMKTLLGLCHPQEGDVHIMGHNVFQEPEKARKEVSSLIESPAFYSYLTPKQNLEIVARFHPDKAIKQADIKSTLAQVGLLPFMNERTSGFSLGMKQRLGLAIAMIARPAFYILDEPSNGLDIEGRVDIRNIILQLSQQTKASFLISSHLSEEIEKTCNVVGVMKDSRLISIRSVDSILSEYPSLENYYLSQIGKAEVISA